MLLLVHLKVGIYLPCGGEYQTSGWRKFDSLILKNIFHIGVDIKPQLQVGKYVTPGTLESVKIFIQFRLGEVCTWPSKSASADTKALRSKL